MSVTPAMIAVALGQAAPGSALVEQQWELWISDAEMLIEDRRVKIGADPVDAAKLDYVAHIKRPDDATKVTIAVDVRSSSRS